MIDLQNLSVAYGGQKVLDEVSFSVGPGDRVGVVGPNGAGKTTLFALIVGESLADRGEINIQKNIKVGYVRQELKPSDISGTLLEYAEQAVQALLAIQHEIELLASRLPSLSGEERGSALHRMGVLQTDFEDRGGYELNTRARSALHGLGFSADDLRTPLQSFSGGWQMRAELARALVARPDLLLLDEPTNFLDIPAIEWLQRFLRGFSGTMLLISHDRYLLNSLTTATLEVVGGRVTRYSGNYDYYVRERRQRYEHLAAAKANQDRRREQIQRFVDRFRAKNTKATQVQSRLKMIEKMDEIVVPQAVIRGPRIRVAKPPRCGVEIMRLEQAGVTYDGQRWVFRELDLTVQRGAKIGLVGLNGTGKTTLLRALAGNLPLNEGRRVIGHNVVVGYQAQDFAETMPAERTVFETIRNVAPDMPEREVRSLLGSFFFSGDAVEKMVSVLSGGEKMRLAFARLLARPPNVLVLDEPTTHLDIAAREVLEAALQDYEGTICLVSHDIEFVKRVATSTLGMRPTITLYPGDYDYYRWKVAEKEAEGAGEEQGEEEVPGKGSGRKAQRRERAARRQELGILRRPFEKAMKAAEDEMAGLEKEQTSLAERLSNSEVAKDYASINRRLGEIQYEMLAATDKWEQAAMALEEIERNADGNPDDPLSQASSALRTASATDLVE